MLPPVSSNWSACARGMVLGQREHPQLVDDETKLVPGGYASAERVRVGEDRCWLCVCLVGQKVQCVLVGGGPGRGPATSGPTAALNPGPRPRHAGSASYRLYVRQLVEREPNAYVGCRIVRAGSGGHLLFNGRVGVAGIDRLCEPPAPAYGAVVGRYVALLRVDVDDVRLVLRLAAAAEDTHNAAG